MIRRHANVFGIMNGKLRINLVSDLAFVANGMIEDRKKRLIAGAVFPMRLAAALVPHLTFLAEIVVFLRIVCAVIPDLPQVSGVHLEPRRQAGVAAHMLGTRAWRVQPANQGSPCRRTHRRGGPAVQINHPFRRQRIQIGRFGIFIAVATQLRSVIFRGNPENIRQLLLRHSAKRHDQAQQKYAYHFHERNPRALCRKPAPLAIPLILRRTRRITPVGIGIATAEEHALGVPALGGADIGRGIAQGETAAATVGGVGVGAM